MHDYYIKDKKRRDRGLIFNLVILLIMILMIIAFIISDVVNTNKKLKDAEVPSIENQKKD